MHARILVVEDDPDVAAIPIPSNDAFVALSSLEVPWSWGASSRTLVAYDAGS